MLKKAYLLLLASVPSIAYTNSDVECCDPFLPPQPIESCQVPVGYFYPAQYTFGDCGFDISLSGEFIYWEVNRDSVSEVGTKIDNFFGIDQVQTPLVHHQGYRPGFKVAAGVGLPGCDDWKLDVEYTWFHHRSSNRFFASAGGIIQQPFVSLFIQPALFGFQASSAKSVLKFDLDFIHGVVGRAFYLSQRLIVNAGLGLKAWWSSLHSDLFYFLPDNGTVSTNRTKSGLWGIGPYVTAQIKGLLWCGTYLYGKAAVWPNYTRFNKFRAQLNFPTFLINSTEKMRKSYYNTQLMYEGSIGLGWGTYLCNCDYHIDLLIGYDMMTTYVRTFSVTAGDPHREFYYQGLSVKAQFDF